MASCLAQIQRRHPAGLLGIPAGCGRPAPARYKTLRTRWITFSPWCPRRPFLSRQNNLLLVELRRVRGWVATRGSLQCSSSFAGISEWLQRLITRYCQKTPKSSWECRFYRISILDHVQMVVIDNGDSEGRGDIKSFRGPVNHKCTIGMLVKSVSCIYTIIPEGGR